MAKALKPADLRAKTIDELKTLLVDLKREQFNLRFQRATGQNEGISRVGVIRRDIARIKTIMGELVNKNAVGASASTGKS
ncbi:50S ribosomal protein L29 [Commensalibacter oyaizuii]|uniref:Large ribosomal subunit protein uL29 n=1 Tax=Commensalibacter oyaizuii TaxID=3043873 RepID=A0ABT6Q0P0_9PROT|nr:50S ribosomal protein L29 [Commensalibacter sp. TBRC 16381]MDI2090682.1 50S ribosomal protein L29 [Commensalibacter sp. TBRC 16381]